MGKRTQKSDFTLSGRFLTYILSKSCEVKGIRLATSQGEQYIKLAKSLRPACSDILQPGTWIQVHGRQTVDTKTGEAKFKAKAIVPALPSSSESQIDEIAYYSAANHQQGKIKICQKSDCRKRGSKQVQRAIELALQESGRTEDIHVQSIGCMGQCKAGPNLVVLPDKTRYTGVKPRNVVHILQQHF